MARPESKPTSRGKLDLATVGGLALALLGILGGLLLEGGKLSDITQITAALIVLGGTIGAVMITTPVATLVSAVKEMPSIFWQPADLVEETVVLILSLSAKARRKGIRSLEENTEEIEDPFLRKGITMIVDGTDLKVVRSIMEIEIDAAEQEAESRAKVYEAAGGYAPTIGIIGAVMGLIQVMKHLEDIEAVGHGIAVAFVATVYGVAFSNLFLLPAANKLKARLRTASHMRELALEGMISVGEGLNSHLIESKLEPFRRATTQSRPEAAAPARKRTPVAA